MTAPNGSRSALSGWHKLALKHWHLPSAPNQVRGIERGEEMVSICPVSGWRKAVVMKPRVSRVNPPGHICHLTVLLLSFIAPLTAFAQGQSDGNLIDQIGKARQEYEAAHFTEAIDLLMQVKDASLSMENMVAINELLARSYIRAGFQDEGRKSYLRILYRNPTWRPDRTSVPPDELAVFQSALRDYEADIVPPRPDKLRARVENGTRITLSWLDNATNEEAYQVERTTGASAAYELIATLTPDVTSYVDAAVSRGQTYSYRVRASGRKGVSPYSNEITLTIQNEFHSYWEWGVVVGISSSRLRGQLVDDVENSASELGAATDVGSITAGTAGVKAGLRIKPSIELQTELAWAENGGEVEVDAGSGSPQKETLKFDYVQIPLLMKAHFAGIERFVRPYFGPLVGFLIGTEGTYESGSGSTSGKIENASSVELSGVAGLEVPLFRLSAGTASLDARYQHSLSSRLQSDSPDLGVQNFSILMSFPLGSSK